MQVTRTKLLSLVIAMIYVATIVAMSGWDTKGVAVVCIGLALPLACIWFADEIAAYTVALAKGPYSRFNTETPASIVTLVGWLILVGYLPLLAYLLVR